MTGRPVRTVHVGLQHWSRDYDSSLPAAARVGPGTEVTVDLHCCSKGAVQRDVSTAPEHFYAELAYTLGMPVTGPIDVAGAEPGDILLVEVLDIRVAPRAWTMAMKDRGVLGSRIETGESRAADRRTDPRVRPEWTPDTAHDREHRHCAQGRGDSRRKARPHGGNMDCRLIEAGASVLLPVLVRALSSLGDLHAVMGDGEVRRRGGGAPVALRLRLLRSLDLPLPFVLTADKAVMIFSADTLDQAATGAVERMAAILTRRAGLSLAGRRHAPQPGWRSSRLPGRERAEDVPDGARAAVLDQLGLDLPALFESYEVGDTP